MRIEVVEPTETSEWRWVVVCPSITLLKNSEVNTWLGVNGIPFYNVGATYWIREREHVELFLLRWS